MKHSAAFVFLMVILLDVQGAKSVRITSLIVPSSVLNGSVPSLILDCDYQLDSPSNASTGLVVKWYHNRGHSPVYQWIPGYPPQAFGTFRSYVNLDHVASEEPLMRHRAIHLVEPRPELSGEFTCKVTTWSAVASFTKRMTIYAPVKTMRLSTSVPAPNRMSVTCEASGVYPAPELSISVQESKTNTRAVRELQVTKDLIDGAYNIRATRELDDREIPARCLIHCQITLPYTTYSVSEKIPHIRGSASFSAAPLLARREMFLGRSLRRETSSTPRWQPSSSFQPSLLLPALLLLVSR